MGQDPDASSPARFRIGLFGGTFDPPHNGHLAVARGVADALALDRVLWIPAGEPPHKSGDEVTAATLRLEMVRAATAAGGVAGPVISVGFTDSIYLRVLGVRAYGFVPFVLSEEEVATMHGNDERVSTENLERGLRVLATAVAQFATSANGDGLNE